MKRKVTAITERTKDGRFSCHIKESLGNYGLAGYGDTEVQAHEDLLTCYEEMKQINSEEGIDTPELEITFL